MSYTPAPPPNVTPPKPGRKRRSPHWTIWLIAAVGVVLLSLIAWLAITPTTHDIPPTPAPPTNTASTTPSPSSSRPGRVSTPGMPDFAPIVMGGGDYNFFTAVAVTHDGSVVAVGNTKASGGEFPNSHGDYDALIAKYGPDGALQWAKSGGGRNEDFFSSVVVADDGSIIAAGITRSKDGDFPPTHDQSDYSGDALLVKYSPDGVMQWVKTYDNSGGTEGFSSIALTGASTIIVVGGTSHNYSDHVDSSPLIAEYDLDGTLLWAKTLDSSLRYGFGSVAVNADDSIIVAGAVRVDCEILVGCSDALLAKFTPDGNLQWVKTNGGTKNDGFYSVALASDGNIYSVGYTMSTDGPFPPSAGNSDTLIAKFDPDGTMQWAKTGGGTKVEWFTGVAVAADGSIIAVGLTNSVDGDFHSIHGDWTDALVAKYSPDGSRVWAKTFGGADDDDLTAVAMTGDNSIVVAGHSASTDGDFPPSHGGWDTLVAIVNQDGTLRQ